MKKLIGLLLLLTAPAVFAQQSLIQNPTWPPMNVKGDVGKEINVIYSPFTETGAALATHASPCITNTNIDALTQTAVNGDSASAQTTLNVTATTSIAAGDSIVIGAGTAREEYQVVASVGAGPTIVTTANLGFTHTSVQGDKVDKVNRMGAPLTAGQYYELYCHDGAGAGVACACLWGSTVVDPIKYTPYQIFAGEKRGFFAQPSPYGYVSCYAYGANKVVDICKVKY